MNIMKNLCLQKLYLTVFYSSLATDCNIKYLANVYHLDFLGGSLPATIIIRFNKIRIGRTFYFFISL